MPKASGTTPRRRGLILFKLCVAAVRVRHTLSLSALGVTPKPPNFSFSVFDSANSAKSSFHVWRNGFAMRSPSLHARVYAEARAGLGDARATQRSWLLRSRVYSTCCLCHARWHAPCKDKGPSSDNSRRLGRLGLGIPSVLGL